MRTAQPELTLTLDVAGEILADAYAQKQRSLEHSGSLPRSGGRGHRIAAAILTSAGAVALGVFVACFVLFAIFVLLNLVFHFSV